MSGSGRYCSQSGSIQRHAHKLFVCGGAGSGKRTLKNNWSMTSWSAVVEKIANVEIITCQEFSTSLVQSSDYVSFVVIYLPEDQESVTSAQQALRAIYDAYDTPCVTLVENRLGDYLYPTQEPDQPPVLVRLTITSSTPPVFWRVSVIECRQLTGVFNSCLVKPLLARLGSKRKRELMCWACSEGKLDVLKLLLPYMDNTDPANYLCCVAAKLSIDDNQKDQTLLPRLREIVEYISNFGDRRRVLKKVGNLVEQYPNGSSLLLNMMGEGIDDQLTCSRLGMACFPISWIVHDDYTIIDLSHNQLKSLPAKLFHLTKLKKLDVSHNQLQSIPSPLSWDCPKLQDLSLGANDLRNEQWKIFSQNSTKIFIPYGTMPQDRASISTLSAPALMRVDISGNVKLSLFPEWLCLLPSLTILDIRGNPLLHTIPPQLSLARHLCVIKLDAEYITSPSPSEVSLGTSAIMTYLRCRHRGSLRFRQIRVVILGEPATGKHSLYTSFVGTNSSSSCKRNMNIGRYDYPQRRFFSHDQPRITFQVVCFTGAESSRHFLSQCFFTHRSIFLVLWKITDGEEGLSRLKQQLRNIQARVPGSPVILVGTHADQNTTITASTVALWEAKLFSSSPHQSTTPIKSMLPPIADSILMNCKSKRDIEQLQLVLYKQALEMKNPRTKKPFIDEMVPRSYVELQSLIQSEVKTIYTLKEGVPVKRRGHFINFVKEHTFHSTELDDTELDVACRFLHDVGLIVHYNVYELNNIYFLDPQWLYNILCKFIDPLKTPGSILHVTYITRLLKEEGGAGLQHYLFKIMELFNISVCLDMDRERFLIPSLLNSKRPKNYPSYDLLSTDVNCKHFHFGYLPNGFCAKLMAQVLLHIKQVLAQLMACRKDDFPVILADNNEVTEVTKECMDYIIDFRTGYVVKDDSVGDDQMMGSGSSSELKRKLMTLGTLPRSPARDSKIFTLTRPMAKENRCHSSYGDLLLGWVYWQEGMYICFHDNTQLWLEPTTEGVAAVVSGDPLLRVKVLSYIGNCVGMLCEEHYLGLAVTVENPCPSCIRCVLRNENGARASNTMQTGHNLTSNDLDISPILSPVNNTPSISITETPDGLPEASSGLQGVLTDSSDIGNLLIETMSQPGTTDGSPVAPSSPSCESVPRVSKNLFEVNDMEFLHPLLAGSHMEPMPTLDHVRSHVKMFTNTECIEKAMMDHVITCGSCDQQVMLKSVDPSVLLEDFIDHLLVDPNLVQCDMDSEELGTGSYAKVYKALYNGTPVALKVYNGRNKQNAMLEQAYKDLRSELSIATQLCHPRIAMVTGVCLNPLGMMQQLAPLGSLREHITKCPCGMQSGIVHSIIEQMANGLDYLHSLFIIHRDVKPSNVLVWSLSPEDGVDVRLTDYGVSQFSSPSGLRSMKGTEEYMAPELCKYGEQSFYDEKVDIFSLGLMIHEMITGHHLFAHMIYKHDKFRHLFQTPPPQLSTALEQALSNCDIFTAVPNKVHPVARLPNQPINTCHSYCFQQLMEACLSQSPDQRPSAKAISVTLGACPASLPQRSFFIGTPITNVFLGSCDDIGELIIGFSPNKWELITITPDKWNFQYHPILHPDDTIASIVCVNKEVWIATEESCRILSLSLPDLEGGHMSWDRLAEKPVFMVSYCLHDNTAILVGMTGGVVAIFDNFAARHLLDSMPAFVDVAVDIEERDPVVCGCSHKGWVWLGCNRHLVAMDPTNHTVTQTCLLSEELLVSHVTSSGEVMWAALQGSSQLIKCLVTANGKLLHKSLQLMPKGIQTSVTAMTMTGDVLWVGTSGGHLFGFNATSCDLLVMRRQHLAIEDMVLLSNHRHMVTFGKSNLLQGVSDENNGSFMVWELYPRPEDHTTK